MIRRCAGLSAARRRRAARLRRVRWAASRRNGSRRPRTSLLLATCLASGSTLCTAEGHPVASCSTWGAPIKPDQRLAVATPPARRHWAQRVISASGNPTPGHEDSAISHPMDLIATENPGRSAATSGVATRKRPPTLTADNQMTRKPNLALNAEMKAVAERLTLPAVLVHFFRFAPTAIE